MTDQNNGAQAAELSDAIDNLLSHASALAHGRAQSYDVGAAERSMGAAPGPC